MVKSVVVRRVAFRMVGRRKGGGLVPIDGVVFEKSLHPLSYLGCWVPDDKNMKGSHAQTWNHFLWCSLSDSVQQRANPASMYQMTMNTQSTQQRLKLKQKLSQSSDAATLPLSHVLHSNLNVSRCACLPCHSTNNRLNMETGPQRPIFLRRP